MDSSTAKIVNSILYFANRSKNRVIDRMKLMKLLWLSDRFHVNKYGRLILRDTYNALPNGPIPSKTLSISQYSFEGYFIVKKHKISAQKDFDPNYFSESDLEVFDYIWNHFGDKDSFELSTFSHKFPEWLRFEEDLNKPSMPNSFRIVMDDFFELPNLESTPGFDVLKDQFSINGSKDSKSKFRLNTIIQSSLSN